MAIHRGHGAGATPCGHDGDSWDLRVGNRWVILGSNREADRSRERQWGRVCLQGGVSQIFHEHHTGTQCQQKGSSAPHPDSERGKVQVSIGNQASRIREEAGLQGLCGSGPWWKVLAAAAMCPGYYSAISQATIGKGHEFSQLCKSRKKP